jgi:hypothetical protein
MWIECDSFVKGTTVYPWVWLYKTQGRYNLMISNIHLVFVFQFEIICDRSLVLISFVESFLQYNMSIELTVKKCVTFLQRGHGCVLIWCYPIGLKRKFSFSYRWRKVKKTFAKMWQLLCFFQKRIYVEKSNFMTFSVKYFKINMTFSGQLFFCDTNTFCHNKNVLQNKTKLPLNPGTDP